jgi:hypothetical protein
MTKEWLSRTEAACTIWCMHHALTCWCAPVARRWIETVAWGVHLYHAPLINSLPVPLCVTVWRPLCCQQGACPPRYHTVRGLAPALAFGPRGIT